MLGPTAWSEPAATNAPVQDEPVEAVLRMNKNPILPVRMDFFFSPLLCPKNFPPPTYHLPTPPPLAPSLEFQRRRVGASLELEPGLLEQELGAVGAGELWLEPERDPHETQVSIFTFFLVCLFCLFCLFVFVMFLWSCATT